MGSPTYWMVVVEDRAVARKMALTADAVDGYVRHAAKHEKATLPEFEVRPRDGAHDFLDLPNADEWIQDHTPADGFSVEQRKPSGWEFFGHVPYVSTAEEALEEAAALAPSRPSGWPTNDRLRARPALRKDTRATDLRRRAAEWPTWPG